MPVPGVLEGLRPLWIQSQALADHAEPWGSRSPQVARRATGPDSTLSG